MNCLSSFVTLGRIAVLLISTFLLPCDASSSSGSSSSTLSSPPSKSSVLWSDVPLHMVRATRRFCNLGSLLGSVTHASPYDRVAGHPVFAITTPWGSPYMNMERLVDLDEVIQPDAIDSSSTTTSEKKTSTSSAQSISEEQNEYRMVALYFMDPDDAISVHGEMKQMDNMQNSDIRILSTSLAKALRQSSNLGHGLVTGVPPHPLDGSLSAEQGSFLRYKIVPPKRQLYYAARCIGKERVGLMSATPTEDAQLAVLGNSALEAANLQRRRNKRERKGPKKKDPGTSSQTTNQLANAHMDGYTGIPVFCASTMRRMLPRLKQLTTGSRYEIPLFFSYEDLIEAYESMRSSSRQQHIIPETPEDVEVFNLWDVLTSMDRDAYKKKQMTLPIWKDPLQIVRKRFSQSSTMPDLDHITFIPSSRSVSYKESISARGNGKARLRPMR